MKWEYQVIELAFDVGKDEAARRLVFLGKQGWEAIGVTNKCGIDRVYLKRQVEAK